MTKSVEKNSNIDTRAAAAKCSNSEAELLIDDFMPFLHACVTQYNMQPDGNRREELLSVAMLAFYEAIKNYDLSKGYFLPFANNVVRKRIIDDIRKVYRHKGTTVSLEDENEECASPQSKAVEELSVRTYDAQNRQKVLAEEIEQFKTELSAWGITMEILSKNSPKHKRVRDTYRKAIARIISDIEIIKTIQIKHYFPVKAVSEVTGLPLKKVERARTFIIASLIIKLGDYDYLSGYIDDRR